MKRIIITAIWFISALLLLPILIDYISNYLSLFLGLSQMVVFTVISLILATSLFFVKKSAAIGLILGAVWTLASKLGFLIF